MGLEYKGGKFELLERSSSQRVHLEVQAHPEALEITSQVFLGEKPYQQAILCRNDVPWISFRLSGRAADKHTLSLRFQAAIDADRASMENPGGVVSRPLEKIYKPTFWPVQHFYHLQDQETGRGLAVLLSMPGAAAFRSSEKVLELVALRNATREKAHGLINLPACPAEGHEKDEHTFQFGIVFTPAGGWQENHLPQLARQYARDPWLATPESKLYSQLAQEIVLSSPDVWLEALKPAWRGEGLIARLCSFALPTQPVQFGLRGLKIQRALLCDARERDLRPLTVKNHQAELVIQQSITTLRLIV
jgi:alpha-mannosidase